MAQGYEVDRQNRDGVEVLALRDPGGAGAEIAPRLGNNCFAFRGLPAGFGIHPYFRRPDRGTIQVPASKRWELSDSLPTGKVVEVAGAYDLRQPRDLDGLSLDDIFTAPRADPAGVVRCHLNDSENDSRTVIEFPAKQFPHIVVYTPPSPRPAIRIEPNTCPTDAFNLQERAIQADVIVLRPGETAQFDVRVHSEPYRHEPGAKGL